eukprot:TRINITY_DN2674_c0_g2_i1.p1 TRINITY_DN2674_c0_g2~~TRINITY_DN2674_c0_g2_i1.p1  ORF type:complete len:382 (+),score=79.42 TRINITY_DN2674_c0_g2_i1:94-1239(+)
MMKVLSYAAVAAVLQNVAVESLHLEESSSLEITASAYESYRVQYARTEKKGSASYQRRLANFIKSRARVAAQNSKPGATWKAAINRFSDYDESEFKAMLGYRRVGGGSTTARKSFLQLDGRKYSFPESINWKNLSSAMHIRDQGGCGSCWAVAVAGTLETHAEIKTGSDPGLLSYKELVDCTPNPQHCGGTGGCSGATAELALQYAQDHGISSDLSYGGIPDKTESCRGGGAVVSLVERVSVAKPNGFVKLPENRQHPLMHAVANKGPVAVSVAAGDWSEYDSGVFNSCGRDATIDHAVTLMGYGTDDVFGKYYLIRNSWGASWGESGYIRLQRFDSDEGTPGHCGTDFNPKEGVGCDGGPSSLPVCGMCGVLSDSAYPEM